MGALRTILLTLGIAVLGTILLTVFLGATLVVTAAPFIAAEYPTPLVEEEQVCSVPCFSAASSRGFTIPDHANRVEAYLSVTTRAGSGPVRVAIYDDDGRARFDHVFGLSDGVQQESASWSGARGSWTMTTSMGGFAGTFDVDILARGIQGAP